MKFRIPYPPSANAIWRSVAGRVLLSAQGRDYRRRVAAALIDQQTKLGFVAGITKPATYSGRITIEIDAYMPDRHKRDIDNLAKATLDALQAAGVYRNDNQIDRLTINRRAIDPPDGRLEITIEAA